MVWRRNELQQRITVVDSLGNAMAMSRKILRFGPSITAVKTVITNISFLAKGRANDPLHIVIFKTLSAFFLAVFFLCDHYIWLFRVGVINNEKAKLQFDFYSSLGWLLECISSLLKNASVYANLSIKYRKTQQKAMLIDTIRIIIDIPVSYSFVRLGSVNAKTVGLFGTITSLIGMYQQWS